METDTFHSPYLSALQPHRLMRQQKRIWNLKCVIIKQMLGNKKIAIIVGIVVVALIIIAVFSGVFDKPENIGEKTFSGVILERKDGNILVVDALSLRGVIEDTPVQVLREVKITEKTKVTKNEKKNVFVYAQEIEKYERENLYQTQEDKKSQRPSPFYARDIMQSELIVGGYVTVTADKNVLKNKDVVAETIELNDSSGLLAIPGVESVSQVAFIGKVTHKEGSGFYLEKNTDREKILVIVDETTRIAKRLRKTEKEFIREISEYGKLPQEMRERASVPVPFQEVPIFFSDLYVGMDNVEVIGLVRNTHIKAISVIVDLMDKQKK